MTAPLILDGCCCQGGATLGFMKAGFEVVGLDIVDQPRYRKRFGSDRFVKGDAIKLLADRGFMRQFDAAHFSFPCQGYTEAQRIQQREHPMLIEPGRELLNRWGGPWTMENVKGAPLILPLQLCGAQFGLSTHRHRLFESSVRLADLGPCPVPGQRSVKMGRPVCTGDFYQAVGNFSDAERWIRTDMGMPWMNRDGLRESIPWQYAEHVGRDLMTVLRPAAYTGA